MQDNNILRQLEYKILSYLESGSDINIILEELNIDEEHLADTIIELEAKQYIMLENKNWALTQQGKDILTERKELLRKLKIRYMYGDVDKEEFDNKRKELELIIEKNHITKEEEPIVEGQILDAKEKDKKIICPNCGKDNRIESKYCSKCGQSLKT